MRTSLLVLACLACASNARRVHTASAFNPSGPAARSTVGHPTVRRPARSHPVMQEAATEEPVEKPFDIRDMAGVSAPLGFFDPFGYSIGISEGKARFYREVEVKHGRVAMLASVGYLVAEKFHPLFGGNIDVPSLVAFQQTPLQTFWGLVVLVIAGLEYGSLASFKSPEDGFWAIRSDHVAGDLGFDPLGLKPKDPAAFKEMQTKELNNGRLAMLAAAGMIAQELVTGKKLF
mmetsp:Transcript_151291/g.278933  ORF Transcript_151291/g.278933 Transcript_151291/m.278933 type:complete len:232 (-) Transcript_151291:78-773(-)